MRLSYKLKKVDNACQDFKFAIGQIRYYRNSIDCHRLYLGSMVIEKFAELSNAQVLALLSEVVTYSNAKIKVEFEDITLELE